jgi:hypothetical protein
LRRTKKTSGQGLAPVTHKETLGRLDAGALFEPSANALQQLRSVGRQLVLGADEATEPPTAHTAQAATSRQLWFSITDVSD